jgi:hypothetical protein
MRLTSARAFFLCESGADREDRADKSVSRGYPIRQRLALIQPEAKFAEPTIASALLNYYKNG